MNQTDENKGLLEELEQRVGLLLQESQDRDFTEYLQKMSQRVRQQKYQTDLLADELDRSYQMYVNRMNLAGKKVGEKANEKADEKTDEVSEQPEVQDASDNSQYFNLIDRTSQSQTDVCQNRTDFRQGHPVMVKSAGNRPKQGSTEFTIGAAVLSVVGAGFILAALVTLGMTFMGGIVKGMCLYGFSLLLLFVSELFLYRRWPMLGSVFSSIGIGGLYLSTALNYLNLHNFNLWVTLGITLGITFFVVLLSNRRESVLYRTIGLIAGYLCFFIIYDGITRTEFLIVSGMVLLQNVLCIILPVHKWRNEARIAHMLFNTLFAISFAGRAWLNDTLEADVVLMFVVSSIVILQVLFLMQNYSCKKEMEVQGDQAVSNIGNLWAYYISTAAYACLVALLVTGQRNTALSNEYCYFTAIAVGGIGLVSMLTLGIIRCQGGQHVYAFLNVMILSVFSCQPAGDWGIVISLLVLLFITKILTWKRPLTFRVLDMVLTVLSCLMLGAYDGFVAEYALLAGVGISILAIHYWQTCYEILLTFTLVIYATSHLPGILQLPVVVGILLVGILLFNNVERWRGKYILVFNGLSLAGQIICFLLLSNPIYQNEYITYLCMLVFGLATIVLTLQKKYRMNFHGKYMVMAIFLTYMALVIRTNMPVVNSILLMGIALVCVGTGFAVGRVAVRIYGLVLSLLVCGKLVFYDFFKAPTMQKMILFFSVGVIALVIAAIYIILEKKNSGSK